MVEQKNERISVTERSFNEELAKYFNVDYDAAGSIGKRYISMRNLRLFHRMNVHVINSHICATSLLLAMKYI